MFPPEVKERAMIACGRRCCLCHKFCGVKMECHHIVQAKDGDDNSFENAIPLCLDHHAEVGHYSKEHPKGIKFTANELKAHRDRWYAQIEKGVPADAPADYVDLDQKLFKRLVLLLGGSSRMTHFRDHDYGNSYDAKIDHRVDDFRHLSELPEFEFFDFQTESAFADLKAAILEYRIKCNNRIWHDHGSAHVPPEWLEENREGKSNEARFWEAVEVMNAAATDIWNAYVQFVRTARQRLKAEEPTKEEIDAQFNKKAGV